MRAAAASCATMRPIASSKVSALTHAPIISSSCSTFFPRTRLSTRRLSLIGSPRRCDRRFPSGFQNQFVRQCRKVWHLLPAARRWYLAYQDFARPIGPHSSQHRYQHSVREPVAVIAASRRDRHGQRRDGSTHHRACPRRSFGRNRGREFGRRGRRPSAYRVRSKSSRCRAGA